MKRLNFNIEQSQYEWLSNRSDELGISISEIIRRALDYFIRVKSNPLETVFDRLSDDPLEVNFPEKPFMEDVIDRLARLEYYARLAVPEEVRQEKLREAREELGYSDERPGEGGEEH